MKIISLGAGVQSSTLLLMSHLGELERADLAIFADTQVEPEGVYEHLAWLEETVDIPVIRVTAGNLGKDTLDHIAGKRSRVASIPFFLKGEGKEMEGMSRRQCTQDYKIAPIRRKIREITKEHVELWIGISTDEIQRMKESNVKYISHRWPLIEQRMSRSDCLEWYNQRGYRQPAKSACTFCPYRKNPEWVSMRDNDPKSFKQAMDFDAAIRHMPKITNECFIHRQLVPIGEVNFGDDGSQMDFGFGNECDGMCGL